MTSVSSELASAGDGAAVCWNAAPTPTRRAPRARGRSIGRSTGAIARRWPSSRNSARRAARDRGEQTVAPAAGRCGSDPRASVARSVSLLLKTGAADVRATPVLTPAITTRCPPKRRRSRGVRGYRFPKISCERISTTFSPCCGRRPEAGDAGTSDSCRAVLR